MFAKNGNAGPCVSCLCLSIYTYESAWHVLFDFPNSAGDTGFANRFVADISFVLMCVRFKASYIAKKSGHFWSIALDIGYHVMRRMYRMSRVQQVERKRGFCGLQSKQKLWFLNAPLVDSLMAWTWLRVGGFPISFGQVAPITVNNAALAYEAQHDW